MNQKKKLETLKDKMLAVQKGDFDVEAENPAIVRCWERLGCTKKECPAYGKLRCWSVAGTCCHDEIQGELAKTIGDCRQCVVYKESCCDELGELIEVFNQTVKDIKFQVNQSQSADQKKARTEHLLELDDMVAALAHETRNPLHSIGLATSYLKKNFHGELVTEFLNIIEEEVGKLNNLTSIFLKFSHPAPLNIELCELNEIVTTTVEPFQGQAGAAEIKLQTKLHNCEGEFQCDSAKLREAISNLLENSFESSKAGDTITVTTEYSKDHVKISVEDDGPGISMEEKKKIFKPFYTTKTNGPGLGLSIIARTVKELNGAVEVTTTPGRGACFSILLPLDPTKAHFPA